VQGNERGRGEAGRGGEGEKRNASHVGTCVQRAAPRLRVAKRKPEVFALGRADGALGAEKKVGAHEHRQRRDADGRQARVGAPRAACAARSIEAGELEPGRRQEPRIDDVGELGVAEVEGARLGIPRRRALVGLSRDDDGEEQVLPGEVRVGAGSPEGVFAHAGDVGPDRGTRRPRIAGSARARGRTQRRPQNRRAASRRTCTPAGRTRRGRARSRARRCAPRRPSSPGVRRPPPRAAPPARSARAQRRSRPRASWSGGADARAGCGAARCRAAPARGPRPRSAGTWGRWASARHSPVRAPRRRAPPNAIAAKNAA
jgi:hypothetical protein